MPGDAVAFSPEGRSVAVASKSQLTLWDVGRGEMIESHTSPAKEDIQEIVFDKAGTTLASSSVGDGLVVLWDVRPLRPRGEPLNGYQTPHQGKLGSSESNFPHRILREGDRGRHVIAFSHDGTMLVSGGIDDSIVFWDVKKGQSVGYYPTNRHEVVYGIAFSPKDDMLATATSQGDVLIWNNGNVRRISSPLSGHHRAWVNAVTFSRDGKTIVSADQAGTMQIWDVSEMRAVGEPMMHPGVARLSLSPDGRTLASSGSRVVLWDMASRKRIAIFGDESTGRLGASFSPDGSTVASANGKTVVLWDVNTKSIVRQFMGHRADVGAVKFSLDGRTLASSGADRRILLWDLHTGKKSGELVVRDGFLNFALSPDGKMVATGSVEGIGDFMLWDVRTGSRVAVLTGHEDAVSDLAFSPDGKVLVSASHDGSLFLWDVDNRDRMGPPLRGHRNSIGIDFPALVLGVALSGSGDSMVSVGTDGHVVLWDLRLASWIDWGCKLAARNLSQAEWDRFLPGKSYQRTCRDLPSGAGAPANAPASIPQ
jgi:WD40 repeat protein